MGMAPEEISLEFSNLTLAQVNAALAYYHANKKEIEDDIAAEVADTVQWEQRLAG